MFSENFAKEILAISRIYCRRVCVVKILFAKKNRSKCFKSFVINYLGDMYYVAFSKRLLTLVFTTNI